MTWYHFIAYFFAGAFLANGIPHYVMGATGRKFPTPFANPPGQGESTPLVNIGWGLANLAVGSLLLMPGSFQFGLTLSTAAFAAGVAGMSAFLGRHFGSVYSPAE